MNGIDSKRRGRTACSLAGATACLALTTAPVLADGPAAHLFLRVGDAPPTEMEVMPSSSGGTHLYQGSIDGDGPWSAGWNMSGELDPSDDAFITGSIDFSNGGSEPLEFELTFDVPLCPAVSTASLLGAYLSISMTSDADGGSLSMDAGDAVWSVMTDGAAAHALFHGPFYMSASGAGTLSTNASFGTPFPSEPGPPIDATLGIRLAFVLSPGESVSFVNLLMAGGDPSNFVACDGGGSGGGGSGEEPTGDAGGDSDAVPAPPDDGAGDENTARPESQAATASPRPSPRPDVLRALLESGVGAGDIFAILGSWQAPRAE